MAMLLKWTATRKSSSARLGWQIIGALWDYKCKSMGLVPQKIESYLKAEFLESNYLLKQKWQEQLAMLGAYFKRF